MNTASGQPLEGVKVLDFTTFLSGPFCTQILADMGADVVKVEPPDGDSSRHIPPHFIGPDSAYFHGSNRSKRSIVLDLKTEEGRTMALELTSKADVVVENFRPGVASRLGLDAQRLRAAHPDLVWASISGFGQTGPMRDKPAYDMIVQALSGAMSLTGEPGRPASRLGIPAGDTVAGLYAAIGILAALFDRKQSGKGKAIDVSMLDCQLAMLSYQSTYALYSGKIPEPQGARHDSIPTYRSFVGGDGREFVVTANTEGMWRGLCRVVGLDNLVDDERFRTAKSRLLNRDALWGLLEAAFLRSPAADWVELLAAEGVPTALIKNVPEALEDARQSGRNMIQRLEQGDLSVEVVGNPIIFTGEQHQPSSFPPALGENRAEILEDWLSAAPGEHRETDAIAEPDARAQR